MLIAAALAGPALAQTPPASGALTVPLGDTAFVANPCPPPMPQFARTLAEPGKAGSFAPEALAAYGRYQAYQRANDWAYLCRYRAENAALPAGKRPGVVFMGDSITEAWALYDPGFFGPERLDRGISGQTTPQMVVRFQQDVVSLKPRVVHIMAGTNDIAGNTGPTSDDQFRNNIAAMVALAQANGIKVILASIPPAKRFLWKPELKPGPKVAELNAWLREFAAKKGAVYADYYAVLADGSGGLRADMTFDGVHPTTAGYAAMRIEAMKAIAQAERR